MFWTLLFTFVSLIFCESILPHFPTKTPFAIVASFRKWTRIKPCACVRKYACDFVICVRFAPRISERQRLNELIDALTHREVA